MGLPNLNQELNFTDFKVLSGREVSARRWKVGDKKYLLIDLEEADKDKDQSKIAINKFLASLLGDSKEMAKLSRNDILYLLCELRKMSEGPTIDFGVTCKKCETENQDLIFDLTEDVKFKPFDDEPITFGNDMRFQLQEIPEKKRMKLLENANGSRVKFNFDILYHSIKSVMYKGEAYNNFTEEELTNFLDGIDDVKAFEKMVDEIKAKISEFKVEKVVTCENPACRNKITVDFGDPESFFVL